MRLSLVAILGICGTLSAVPTARAQDAREPLDTRPFGALAGQDTDPATTPGDNAATATGAAATTTPALPAARAAEENPLDASITGSVTRAPAENPRVARVPMVDNSDPATGFLTGVSLRRTIDDDPWAQLGHRVGSFIFYPSVDTATGYTSNASKSHGGKGAAFGIIAPEFLLQSDWSRHEMTLAARGSYEAFSNGTAEPAAELQATGRIDLPDLWLVNLESHYRYGRESASDPNGPNDVDRPSDIHTYGGLAALNGALGRNVITLETFADRFTYGDARAKNGHTINQSDRNNDLYGTRLRLGYPLSGSLTPFIEGELTRRQYDDRVDDNGIERSSTGDAIRLGVQVKRDPVTTGEIAIGYSEEHYDDDALKSLGAFTVDGSLAWSPVELVTVTTNARSEIVPSTNPRSSGSLVYEVSSDLAYAYRRNATANLTARVRNEQFGGIGRFDWTYGLGIGTTWRVNRVIEIALTYTHDWLQSNRKNTGWTADEIRFDARFRF